MMSGVNEIQNAAAQGMSLAYLRYQLDILNIEDCGTYTYRPSCAITSVYFFALGTILPIVLLQNLGRMRNTAVEAQNPPQSTLNQIDHQRSPTSQTTAPGTAVRPMMPGIQRRARTGMM